MRKKDSRMRSDAVNRIKELSVLEEDPRITYMTGPDVTGDIAQLEHVIERIDMLHAPKDTKLGNMVSALRLKATTVLTAYKLIDAGRVRKTP